MNMRAFAIAGLILLGLGFVAWRPAVVLGVEPGALARSVSGEVGGSSVGSNCRDRGSGDWFCSVMDREGSSGTGYSVNTRGLGCWDAARVGRPVGELQATASGCIGFFDELSPL